MSIARWRYWMHGVERAAFAARCGKRKQRASDQELVQRGKLIETLVGKPTLVELTETKPPVLASNPPRGSALLEARFGAQFCVGGSPRASFGTQERF